MCSAVFSIREVDSQLNLLSVSQLFLILTLVFSASFFVTSIILFSVSAFPVSKIGYLIMYRDVGIERVFNIVIIISSVDFCGKVLFYLKNQ